MTTDDQARDRNIGEIQAAFRVMVAAGIDVRYIAGSLNLARHLAEAAQWSLEASSKFVGRIAALDEMWEEDARALSVRGIELGLSKERLSRGEISFSEFQIRASAWMHDNGYRSDMDALIEASLIGPAVLAGFDSGASSRAIRRLGRARKNDQGEP